MNVEFLSKLGIEENQDLKSILEQLEEKQFEYLERMETVSDETRREEISELLQTLDEEISSVKEQMQAVNTAIVLDDGSAALEEPSANEVKQKEKEEKERQKEELASKVEALKELEAQQQAKEEERKARQEEKEAQRAEAEAVQDTADASVEASDGTTVDSTTEAADSESKPLKVPKTKTPNPKTDKNHSEEFKNALIEYKKQNYTAAFTGFKDISEEKNKRKENPTAMYMLACMYQRGEGTTKDEDRAKYWMEQAANEGEPDAQFGYGSILLSAHKGNFKEIHEGLRYLMMAGNQGHAEAMEKFVEAVKQGHGNKNHIKKAMKYCGKLQKLSADSYERKQIDDAKKELKKALKKTKKGKLGCLAWIIILIGIYFGVSKFAPEVLESAKEYLESKMPGVELLIKEKVNELTGKEIFDLEEQPDNDVSQNDEEPSGEQNQPIENEPTEPTGSAQEPQDPERPVGKTIRITGENVNIRKGAGVENDVITQAKNGVTFVGTGRVEAAANGRYWYEIYLNEDGETGWVSETVSEQVED